MYIAAGVVIVAGNTMLGGGPAAASGGMRYLGSGALWMNNGSGITVLGSFPSYVELAEELGAIILAFQRKLGTQCPRLSS
jgi:hypothetical protein